MKTFLTSTSHNLRNLLTFSGRDTRTQFWPYAALIFGLANLGIMAAMLPEMLASMIRMQKFAMEHPELATIQQGPGSYSISIEGHHPELMPDMASMIKMMALVLIVFVACIGASVVRRLHDRGKSGAWAIMPLPFAAFACVMTPRVFAQDPPAMEMFFAMFFNNALYIGSLIFLVVLLIGPGSRGDNRYGTEPGPRV